MYKNNDFENALSEGKEKGDNKNRCLSFDSSNETKPSKSIITQLTLERCGTGKEKITQHNINELLMTFVINETQPLRVVDKPSFINLVRLGLTKDL